MASHKDAGDGTEASAEPIDTRLVRRLAGILRDSGLTEIEVERGDLRIRVAREPAPGFGGPPPPAPVYAAPPPPPTEAAPAIPAAAAPTGELVKSPMVGTVYLQAQPGSPPFVRRGDRVVEGQTLLIVEAMKTMNPVPAPRAGVIAEILVEDNQPVEYGAPLVALE